MTSSITARNVEIVSTFLKGKRLGKLLTSIELLRAAEKRGSFEPREAQKAIAGFGPGLMTREVLKERVVGDFADSMARYRAEHCIRWGFEYTGVPFSIEGVSQEIVDAWIALCNEAHRLHQALKVARPRPTKTAIGLSPKVTATLTGMNLEIDLPTITPAELEPYQVQARHPKTRELLFQDGQPVMETRYRVKWTEGTRLNMSRFRGSNCCEACGKWIPSAQFVAVEAECKKNGRVGLWLGRDCALNIFGVKDLGIER